MNARTPPCLTAENLLKQMQEAKDKEALLPPWNS